MFRNSSDLQVGARLDDGIKFLVARTLEAVYDRLPNLILSTALPSFKASSIQTSVGGTRSQRIRYREIRPGDPDQRRHDGAHNGGRQEASGEYHLFPAGLWLDCLRARPAVRSQ
jgi:hypothetical protein